MRSIARNQKYPRTGRKNQAHMSAHLHFKEIASDLAAPFSCYRVFHLGHRFIINKAPETRLALMNCYLVDIYCLKKRLEGTELETLTLNQ